MQGEDFPDILWETLKREGNWQGQIWNRRKNGEVFLEWATITQVLDVSGRPSRYVAIFNDITDLHRKDEQIKHQAYHDALTGLAQPSPAVQADRAGHRGRPPERSWHRAAVHRPRPLQDDQRLARPRRRRQAAVEVARAAEVLRPRRRYGRAPGRRRVHRRASATPACRERFAGLPAHPEEPARSRSPSRRWMRSPPASASACFPNDGARRRDAAEARRHRDVRVEAAEPEHHQLLHRRHDAQDDAAAGAGERPAPGDRQRRAGGPLPAQGRHHRRRHLSAWRRCCAGTIRRADGAAGRVHPAGRGDRA